MKLKELLKLLVHIDKAIPDAEVILSRDPEGNGFHGMDDPCHSYANRYPDSQEFEHVDELADANAVILWPGGVRHEC